MLDICYYNTQIKDELDGACEYYDRAKNYKESNPTWMQAYEKMGDMELEHAKTLLQLYDEDLASFKMEVKDPTFLSYLEAESKVLHKMYTEQVSRIQCTRQ